MVDDWRGIGLTEAHAGFLQRLWRRRPWRVDDRIVERGEFGNPAADVLSARVEFLPLQDRIEDAEIGRRVGAGARHPLPARRIIGGIGVAERIPEPCLAAAPVA